jgi:hypothetical protein
VLAIRDERELTYDKRLPTNVEQRAVEASFVVAEDAKPRDLVGQTRCGVERVVGRDAHENDDTGPTRGDHLSLHDHRRFPNPLHDGTHTVILTVVKRERESADTSGDVSRCSPLADTRCADASRRSRLEGTARGDPHEQRDSRQQRMSGHRLGEI